MRETEFTDYTLREFELTSDNNVSVKTYHYFIPCLGIYNHVSDCSCEVTYCNKLRLQWDLNSFNIEGRGGGGARLQVGQDTGVIYLLGWVSRSSPVEFLGSRPPLATSVVNWLVPTEHGINVIFLLQPIPRTIYQFHYTGWPDHGVPKDPSPVLHILHEVHSRQQSIPMAGPIIVHCR